MIGYAQKAYQTNNVQSMTPGEQVARLLETAAKHLLRAKGFIEEGNPAARFEATEDALKIIQGLQSCLNITAETEEVAGTLERYYIHITLQVSHINVHNDAEKCTEVSDSLRTMANTWREIEKRAKGAAMPENSADSSATVAQSEGMRLDSTTC